MSSISFFLRLSLPLPRVEQFRVHCEVMGWIVDEAALAHYWEHDPVVARHLTAELAIGEIKECEAARRQTKRRAP